MEYRSPLSVHSKERFPNTQINGKPPHVPTRLNIIKTSVPPKQSMYLIPIKITMVTAAGMEKSILNFKGNQQRLPDSQNTLKKE